MDAYSIMDHVALGIEIFTLLLYITLISSASLEIYSINATIARGCRSCGDTQIHIFSYPASLVMMIASTMTLYIV